MPIESHLRSGERVLAASDGFYATSRRLIKFSVRGKRETVGSLAYHHIGAVARRRRLRTQTLVLALLVILLALVVGPQGGVKAVLVLIGVLGLIFAFINPTQRIEFQSDGENGEHGKPWRLDGNGTKESSLLSEVVQAYLEGGTLPQFTAENRYIARGGRPRRSVLLLPADRADQLTVALDLRPDSICLDLGDTVAPERRDAARAFLWGEVTAASRSYSEVLVRLSSPQALEELTACVWPGLAGIVVPVRTVAELLRVGEALQPLEETRRLPLPVKLLPLIEGTEAAALVGEITSATSRVDAVILSLCDLAGEESLPAAGVQSSSLTWLDASGGLWRRQQRAALTATVEGVQVLGVMWAGAPGGLLDEGLTGRGTDMLRDAAQRAQAVGYAGALTPHWQGVEACNSGFGASSGEEQGPWSEPQEVAAEQAPGAGLPGTDDEA